MTFWIILVIAGFLTLLSFRYRNILISLGGSLGWFALWMYNFDYPPANITIGSTLHEVLIYVFIIMAVATMLMYFRNRARGYTGYTPTKSEEAESEARRSPARGLMDLTPTEYQRLVRTRLRRRR